MPDKNNNLPQELQDKVAKGEMMEQPMPTMAGEYVTPFEVDAAHAATAPGGIKELSENLSMTERLEKERNKPASGLGLGGGK